VAALVTSYALAYPEKRFTLQHNDRLVARTNGTGALADALLALYGLDVVEQMIEIPLSAAGGAEAVRVWGHISAPSLPRPDRHDMHFFVNRRWIQDNSLSYAVAEAYRTLLPQGRHPVVVLNIALPPEEVDVNIHPTKREVRFRNAREIFAALQKAVRTTLMAQHPIPLASAPFAPFGGERRRSLADLLHPSAQQAALALEVHRSADLALGPLRAEAALPPSLTAPSAPGERLPMLRVVGQVAQTYIIAEGPGGMYLIDQHAAHERIRYEELRAQHTARAVSSQELLEPLPLELAPTQATLLEAHLPALADYGLQIIPFGGSTFLVKSVPTALRAADAAEAIAELLDAAQQGGAAFSWEEQALITLACHTAVRAGQTLSPEEMRDLVRQLERAALPHTCPHGRPTMIHLSQAQLEKEFGRR
jgi:DNA mismatch repair protein MutL